MPTAWGTFKAKIKEMFSWNNNSCRGFKSAASQEAETPPETVQTHSEAFGMLIAHGCERGKLNVSFLAGVTNAAPTGHQVATKDRMSSLQCCSKK